MWSDIILLMRIRGGYIVAILMSVIIGGSILGYGYMDYSYKKELLEREVKAEVEAKQVEAVQFRELQNCLDQVMSNAVNYVKGKTDVSYEETQAFMDIVKLAREECYRKHPQ